MASKETAFELSFLTAVNIFKGNCRKNILTVLLKEILTPVKDNKSKLFKLSLRTIDLEFVKISLLILTSLFGTYTEFKIDRSDTVISHL